MDLLSMKESSEGNLVLAVIERALAYPGERQRLPLAARSAM